MRTTDYLRYNIHIFSGGNFTNRDFRDQYRPVNIRHVASAGAGFSSGGGGQGQMQQNYYNSGAGAVRSTNSSGGGGQRSAGGAQQSDHWFSEN